MYAVSLAQGVCNQFGRELDTVYADSLAEGWYCVCSQFGRGLDAVHAVSLAQGWKMCILMRSFPSLTISQTQ